MTEQYTIGNFLGGGTFGRVYRLRDENGDQKAIKIYLGEFESNLTEIDILFRIQNTHLIKGWRIAKMLKSQFPDLQKNEKNEENDVVGVVEDLVDGGMDTRERNKFFDSLGITDSKLRIQMVGKLIYQCVSALHCLAKAGYYHADIKPDNMLYLKTSDVITDISQINFFIGDYGLMIAKNDLSNLEENVTYPSILGTGSFIAPEILSQNTRPIHYNSNFFIWSLGASLYEIIVGEYLLTGLGLDGDLSVGSASLNVDLLSLKDRINDPNVRKVIYQKMASQTNSQTASLIMQMLTYDPSERINLTNLLVPFKNLKDECLVKLPELSYNDKINMIEKIGNEYFSQFNSTISNPNLYYCFMILLWRLYQVQMNIDLPEIIKATFAIACELYGYVKYPKINEKLLEDIVIQLEGKLLYNPLASDDLTFDSSKIYQLNKNES